MTNQLLTESAGEISAVALLKLMMRVESATVAVGAPEAACEVTFDLSPYLQDQLQSIAAALFHRDNADFYRQYRLSTGAVYDIGAVGEFAFSGADLRPLAYRALMQEGEHNLAPRFAQSLLTLARYWDCDFMGQYKDVAGRLTAHSARKLLRKF